MNKSTKLIRWGIIGCGNVTEVKSGPAYQKTEGFTIEAVMRRDAVPAYNCMNQELEVQEARNLVVLCEKIK